MISLETVLDEQKEIESLCQAKHTEAHRVEFYKPNNNYGFASILKQYAGYPLDKPIMGVIPHGVYTNDHYIYEGELDCILPKVLNYPAFRQSIWKKLAKKKTIIASASPFLYALKLFKTAQLKQKKPERKGTLFFHSHSTASTISTFNKDLLLEKLLACPEEMKPITICLHWHDIQLGLHHFFKENGFDVVSAGHLLDENFFFRWLHLLSRHQYSLSNKLGGSLFYSVAAGVPYLLIDTEAICQQKAEIEMGPIHKQSKACIKRNQLRIDKIETLFSTFSKTISDEQIELVNYYLGKANFKSTKNLYKELQA